MRRLACLALCVASACGGWDRFAAPETKISVELPCKPAADATPRTPGAKSETTWRCATGGGVGGVGISIAALDDAAWSKSTAREVLAAADRAALAASGSVLIDQVEAQQQGRPALVTLSKSGTRAILRRAFIDQPHVVALIAEGGTIDEARTLGARLAATVSIGDPGTAAATPSTPTLKTADELCLEAGGKMIESQVDGLLERACTVNGKKSGPALVVGDQGRIVAKGTYRDDARDGSWVSWYPDGAKRSEDWYERGRRNGPAAEFSPQGVKVASSEWLRGMKHGRFVDRGADNVVLHETEWREDKKDGVEVVYLPTGQKESETTWAADARHGRSVKFHKNGAPASIAMFAAGVEEGPFSSWDETGNPQLYRIYRKGRVVTEVLEDPCPQGSDEKVRRLSQQVLERWCERLITRMVRNGYFYRQEQFVGRDGPYRSYSVNGLLEIAGQYDDGEKHGRWTRFDGEGRVTSVEYWEKGTLTATETPSADDAADQGSSTKKTPGSSASDSFPSFHKEKAPKGAPSKKAPVKKSRP